MESNPNLVLWNKYALPPKEALKPFDNGTFKGTDISPVWRIRCLTEEFGPCGTGWYADIVDRWREECGDIVMTFVTVKLYVRNGAEWSAPITATGGNKMLRKKGGVPSDEAYKMAYTDALGGACKMLGIGGSVYWEKGYSKYEADYVADESPKVPKGYRAAEPPPPGYIGPVIYTETPEETWEDVDWRARITERFPKEKLDRACMKYWGTDFDHTPVATIKTKINI